MLTSIYLFVDVAHFIVLSELFNDYGSLSIFPMNDLLHSSKRYSSLSGCLRAAL